MFNGAYILLYVHSTAIPFVLKDLPGLSKSFIQNWINVSFTEYNAAWTQRSRDVLQENKGYALAYLPNAYKLSKIMDGTQKNFFADSVADFNKFIREKR
jgi:hypothetical protein